MNFKTSFLISSSIWIPSLLLGQTIGTGQANPAADPLRLKPYVVTAPQTKEPLSVEIDPRAPAQPMPANDGADLLKGIPGFGVTRKGGTDGDLSFRGLAGSRLGVLLDGECLYGGCGNRMDPPTAYVFPSAYDRVKIVKGPQSVLHGPGNSAGIVLFEREQQRLSTPTAKLDVQGTAGSFGRLDGMAEAQGGTSLAQARVTVTRTRSDNYEDGDGNEVHSSYARWGANADVLWTPDERTLLEFTSARSDGEVAYADRAMDGVKFDRDNYGLRLRREKLSPFVTAVELRWYRNYVDHVMDNYSLRTFVASGMMPNLAVSNPDRLTRGGKIVLELSPGESLKGTVGLDAQGNRHTLRSSSNQALNPYLNLPRQEDASFNQWGLFGEGTWRMAGASRLVGGARLDKWKAEDSRKQVSLGMMSAVANPSYGHQRRSDLLSGFVRLERDLDFASHPSTAYLGIGRVQRFPDYWELIKNESSNSVSGFGSRPETSTQLDAGLVMRGSVFDLSLGLFAANLQDYLLVQSNVAKPSMGMGSRSTVITRNIDASTLGGELALGWRFAEGWKGDLSLAYVRGENDTDSLPLAQEPPLEGRLGLSYTSTDWSVGGVWRLVDSQNRVAINQGNIVGQDIGVSQGFSVLSLNASYRLGSHLRLSVGVDNLFDKTYAEHISRAGAGVAGFVQTRRVNEPGRTLWVRCDARF